MSLFSMGARKSDFKYFTIGIEEEYMVLDPVTRELKSHQQLIVQEGQKKLGEKIKAEMHQAVVEVGTDVCNTIQAACNDIYFLRQTISKLAEDIGLWVGASGTHPFSLWTEQLITGHDRYRSIVNELQDAARSNLIFGLHVHIGMEDRKIAQHIANAARYFLPHVYALSTNSPFWEGRTTGYKSYRSKVFDKFPRTGIPDYFEDAEQYEKFVQLLIKTNCIDNAKKIWWDLRVHPFYNTVEFRICDVPLSVKETVAIAALFQAICAKLYILRKKNMSFIMYQRALINENKWRASRYGLEGKLIDFGKEEEVDTKVLIEELIDFVDDVLTGLGSRKEISYIEHILNNGTGADKQIKVFKETNSLVSVVDAIHNDFLNI